METRRDAPLDPTAVSLMMRLLMRRRVLHALVARRA